MRTRKKTPAAAAAASGVSRRTSDIVSHNGRRAQAIVPTAQECEAALLGSMIYGRVAEVAAIVTADDLIDDRHRAIFAAITHLFAREGRVDSATLIAHLRDRGELEAVGGIEAIADICEAVPSEAGAEAYARQVREAAQKRDLLDAAERMIANASHCTPSQIIADFAERTKTITAAAAPTPISLATLQRDHPTLNAPVVEGIARRGEVVNIIAAPKVGKSWLVYDLALSIVAGRWWLATFRCSKGRVLIIDNELHGETIAHRIPQVAEARGLGVDEYADHLDILPLRGQGVTLDQLARYIDRIEAGHYAAIAFDAWYRFVPAGMNENANADVAALFNLLDRYAAQTQAALFVVHHSSKGGQGDKSITDVGAGAGAQSRAADAHLVLRPHEEDGCVVLEAAVRSFAPVEPVGLEWQFPVWEKAHNLDTRALKGRKTKNEERQDERDAEGLEAILNSLADGPLSGRQIRASASLGRDRAERLLASLVTAGKVVSETTTGRGGTRQIYRLQSGPLGRPLPDHLAPD